MNCIVKRALFASATVAVLSVFLVGCGSNEVAKVNGTRITQEEYASRLQRVPMQDPQTGQQVEAGEMVLRTMIDEALVLGLAKKEGVEPSDDQVNARIADAKAQQPNIVKDLKKMGISEGQFKQMMRVRQAVVNLKTKGVKVSDQEVKEFYDKNKKTIFTEPEQALLAVIVTKTKADADKAIDMLKQGISFETVARQFSIDPATKANGGRVPRPMERSNNVSPDVKKVQDLIFSTQNGKYTAPIRTSSGDYTIFQVIRKSEPKLMDFKKVEYKIRENLSLQKGEERKNDVVSDLQKYRETSKIGVNIDRYKERLMDKGAGEHSEDDGHEH